MGMFSQLKQSSVKNIQMANYLLSTTYPMIREPKTLLSISNHILSSFISTVSLLLYFERQNKTIPPYHDTNESKINCFKQNLVKKYKFEEYLMLIERLVNLSKEHKNASIEFSRDRKYVICADQFSSINTISEQDVKNYIKKAKEFYAKVEGVIPNE